MAGLLYIMEFKNVEDTLVKVVIGDINVPEIDNPIIKYLLPAGTPVIISTIDNEENKWTPIRAQQATITFHSNEDADLETFADGPDDRFPVTIYYGVQIIFKGFLSLNDNKEAFLPQKNEVTLTATDKLGALKETDIIDFNGVNPQGKYTIAQLVMMCLERTGLSMRLNVMHNLKHGSGQRTMLATFHNDSNTIIVSNANASFFYTGQVLTVSGTVSNNGTLHVLDIGVGIVGIVAVSENLTFENEVSATFTDVTDQEHFFNHFLDAKTFEKEIGTSINCYDVLAKILGYDCFLCQYNNEWWIMRIDEYDEFNMYVARFDENGVLENIYQNNTLLKTIGHIQDHWLSGEATVVSPTRPLNFAKLTYNFEYPLEILCNQDFERGDVITPPDLGVPTSEATYEIDCWTQQQFPTSGTAIIPANNEAYIKRIFEYGYEKQKYIVLTSGPAAANEGIMSQPVPIRIKDKLDVSVNWRLSGNVGAGDGSLGVKVFSILIIDKDGGYWYLSKISDGATPEWLGPFDGQRNAAVNFSWIPDELDETEWQNVIADAPPSPAEGNLYIGLFKEWQGSGVYEVDTHYENLEVTITPFINGSYRTYRGRYEKVSRDDDGYLANVDDEVYISDAERELFKGALFFFDNPNYYLTQRWYPAHRYALGFPPDVSFVFPFGKHQAFAVWNQGRLANRIFQFQFQGLGEDIPSLVHKYSISDVSTHSINRKFLMLTCEKDLFNCQINGTLDQVFHTVQGKDFTSPHEFKYIT